MFCLFVCLFCLFVWDVCKCGVWPVGPCIDHGPRRNPPPKKKSPPRADFAKRLQALARQEDKELLRVFEASFEGPEGTRREADFDAEFFFENARGLLDDKLVVEDKGAAQEGK